MGTAAQRARIPLYIFGACVFCAAAAAFFFVFSHDDSRNSSALRHRRTCCVLLVHIYTPSEVSVGERVPGTVLGIRDVAVVPTSRSWARIRSPWQRAPSESPHHVYVCCCDGTLPLLVT